MKKIMTSSGSFSVQLSVAGSGSATPDYTFLFQLLTLFSHFDQAVNGFLYEMFHKWKQTGNRSCSVS